MTSSLIETPGTLRPVLRLALPVLLEQFLGMLIGLSDRTLTGHYLGAPHLAAITTSAYLLWLTYEIFSMVAVGAGALVARSVGAGDYGFARRVTTQAFLLGALISALVVPAAFLFLDQLVAALHLEGEAGGLATSFLRFMIPIIPLMATWTVGVSCLRAAGDTVTGLMIMVAVNAVNIAVSWALVVGVGPIPSQGLRGIAIGTVTGNIVGSLLILGLLLRGRSGLKIQWRQFWPDWGILRRLLWIGLPASCDTLSIVGCQLWFISVINQLGVLAMAAHGVALIIESLALLPGVAFQVAASTLAGQFLGARDSRMASRSVWTACLVGGGLMISAGVVLFTAAAHLTPLLVRSDQTEVIRLATPLLRTISLAMPSLALLLILTGALRGAGDTRWPLLFSLIGLLGVRIPAAYWFAFSEVHVPGLHLVIAGWGLGVLGTWYAMVSDLSVRATLVLFRFSHGGWKRIHV